MDALVDTGATYLVLLRAVVESLAITPSERRPFVLADGREVTFEVGDVLSRLDGRAHPVLTVFGEAGARPLLGSVPLETFGLAVDPVNRRLVPAPGLLMVHKT